MLLILDLTDLDPNGKHPVRGNCNLAMSIGTLNVQAVAVVAAVDVPSPTLSRESDTDGSDPAKIGPEYIIRHFHDCITPYVRPGCGPTFTSTSDCHRRWESDRSDGHIAYEDAVESTTMRQGPTKWKRRVEDLQEEVA